MLRRCENWRCENWRCENCSRLTFVDTRPRAFAYTSVHGSRDQRTKSPQSICEARHARAPGDARPVSRADSRRPSGCTPNRQRRRGQAAPRATPGPLHRLLAFSAASAAIRQPRASKRPSPSGRASTSAAFARAGARVSRCAARAPAVPPAAMIRGPEKNTRRGRRVKEEHTLGETGRRRRIRTLNLRQVLAPTLFRLSYSPGEERRTFLSHRG